MKKLFLLILIISINIFFGCSARPQKIDEATPSSITKDNKEPEQSRYGVYYVYKSCSKKNILPNGECKKGQAREWNPIKNADGQFITPYDSVINRYDDFYFIFDEHRSSIFFSESFAEGYAIGWADVDVKNLNGQFKLKVGSKYLTDDIGYNAAEEVLNYDRPKSIIGVVGNYFDKYKFKGNSELILDVLSETGFSINCEKYIYYQNKTIGPISNLCDADTSKIWLKKVATISELQKINAKQPQYKQHSAFSQVSFGGYLVEQNTEFCSFKVSPVNYCDQRHILLYKDALLNGSVNFNQKFILLPILEYPQYNQYSLVVINSENGTVYPLPIDWYESEMNGKEALKFNLDTNRVCINGSGWHYKQEDKGKDLCFQFDGERFTGYQTNYMHE